MGSNPVESPEFFRFMRQLLKLSSKCEDHIFIRLLQLQRKRHIKIELCIEVFCDYSILVALSKLFHIGRVVQNRRSALSLVWHEWFSCKGEVWKIYCCELAWSSEPQIWKFHVVVWQTTSKHCIKKRTGSAAQLFFFIQPIKSLICGAVVDVAVVKS